VRFLLVDRIIELERGQRAVGVKNVTMSEDFFADHFPEQPIMPGALLAESLVQLADWIIREDSDFQQTGLPVGFEKLKFLRLAQPGDQLRLEVEIVSRDGCEATAKGRVRCDGEVIATAAFTLQVHPIEPLLAVEETKRQFRVLLGEGRRQHAPGRELW
jgi:3-hydroxyacyl-[acyl-carrier-protein] dehydratase